MELLVLSVILLVVIIELIELSIKETLFNFYNMFPLCEDYSDNPAYGAGNNKL